VNYFQVLFHGRKIELLFAQVAGHFLPGSMHSSLVKLQIRLRAAEPSTLVAFVTPGFVLETFPRQLSSRLVFFYKVPLKSAFVFEAFVAQVALESAVILMFQEKSDAGEFVTALVAKVAQLVKSGRSLTDTLPTVRTNFHLVTF